MFLFSILYKGKNVGPLYSVYLTQILNTTPSKWNMHLRWLSEKDIYLNLLWKKWQWMKMRNPQLRPGKQTVTQVYELFYNSCIVWWCCRLFVCLFVFSDTIKIIFQLKFCSEEEYRSRIASPFLIKTSIRLRKCISFTMRKVNQVIYLYKGSIMQDF